MTENTTTAAAVDTDATAPDATPTVEAIVAAALTGDLSAYLAGDRSTRARVRAAIVAGMKAAMKAGDVALAMSYNAADDALGSASSARAAAPVIDWNAITRDRIATLRHAAWLLETDAARVDGTPDGFTYEPDAEVFGTVDDAYAVRVATARATRSGNRNDVGAAIRAAFAGESDGTVLTVAEIGRRWEAAGGPSNNNGRIKARIFATDADGAPACTVAGIVPVPSSAASAAGARCVGDWMATI